MSELAVMPLSDYVGLCDAIREKTGTTDVIKSGELVGFVESIEAGGGNGDNLELERYATSFQVPSLNVFGKSEVVLNLDSVTSLEKFLDIPDRSGKNTTLECLTINCLNPLVSIKEMLSCPSGSTRDTVLKYLTLNINTTTCVDFTDAYGRMSALISIDGTPFDFSANESDTISPFPQCSALTDFRVVANSIKNNFFITTCPNLSIETFQSIIDGLADLIGQTTQTLTIGVSQGDVLTDEQKATITAKNWTLVY